jgi:hypothetical protein
LRLSVLDGCAVPRPLYPVLRKLKHESGCTFNSVYRGDDAAGILHRHGKHTQRELYETLPAGTANPPGRSTHELRSDGVPYPGPIGRKLRWWQCGLDVNDWEISHVIDTAKKLGWELFQPYPSGTEYHHLNFRRRPARWRLIFHAVFGPKRRKHRPSGGKRAPAAKHAHRPPRHHPHPTPTVMFDSIDLSQVPSNAPAVACYTSGNWPTYEDSKRRFPKARHLSIAVSSAHDADCLDVEPGDATPQDAPRWVRRQLHRGIKRPVVYASVSSMAGILAQLAAHGIRRDQVRLWTAHYTHHPHRCSPACGFGLKTTADATQWTDRARGRTLDESHLAKNFFA